MESLILLMLAHCSRKVWHICPFLAYYSLLYLFIVVAVFIDCCCCSRCSVYHCHSICYFVLPLFWVVIAAVAVVVVIALVAAVIIVVFVVSLWTLQETFQYMNLASYWERCSLSCERVAH